MSTSEPPDGSRRGFLWGAVAGVAGSALIGAVIVVAASRGDGGPAPSPSTSAAPSTAPNGGQPTTTATVAVPSTRSSDRGSSASPATTSTLRPPASSAAGAPPPPAGAGTPTEADVTCSAPTTRVATADELQRALAGAAPGTTIGLADGTYVGAFTATTPGTAEQPIFLCGGPGAILDGGGPTKGYVFHLQQVRFWRLVGFTVRNGQKGVVADGVSNCVIQGLTVEQIGDEGIHLRSASTDNAVVGNTVRATGLRRDKFGEGIYVGSAMSNWPTYSGGGPDRSDHNLVAGNTISGTTSESIDIKEGTTGGRVIGNLLDGTGMSAADSLIDVKGNDWLIQGNVARHGPKDGMQTHRILEGWGTGNTFSANVVDIDGDGGGDGNHFYIHDPEVTDNRVACDNRTSSGVPLVSNVDCLP